MRILFLGNNWLAAQIVGWLREQNEEIVGLVLHPPERRSHGSEILANASLPPERILDGSRVQNEDVLDAIRGLKPDIGISVLFGYILKEQLLQALPVGCINLHPALLPYNRGAYPNVWSIIDGTPAGVSLHFIDPGIDTGDVIAQTPVEIEPTDTGETLYRKLERRGIDLFKETWPLIRSGQAPRRPQAMHPGTTHRVRDVEAIDEIFLDRTYRARDLLNLIRARTFPPHRGAYFVEEGRRVLVRVHLEYENGQGSPDEGG